MKSLKELTWLIGEAKWGLWPEDRQPSDSEFVVLSDSEGSRILIPRYRSTVPWIRERDAIKTQKDALETAHALCELLNRCSDE